VSVGGLNLSRRPFVNGRPVTRIALLLWLLGGLLLLGNVFVSMSYVAGTGEKRQQLAQVEQQKEKEQRSIQMLNDRFANLNLAGQNEQVDFLNEKIDERTFSWSLLLDRMSKLLPQDVRLTRMTPHGVVDTQSERRRRGAPPPVSRKKPQEGRVTLAINGEAKDDESLLRFVDNLFADPAFVEPDLLQETKQETKEGTNSIIKFDLRVGYLPKSPARPTVAAPESRSHRRSVAPPGTADSPGATGVPGVGPVQPLASAGAPGRPSASASRVPRAGVPGAGIPGVGVPPPLRADGGPGR
jgi:Tfp pilus assembly protein PilN